MTVTHPEVIRYFMSIPEAAALVIQAGAMATGGEVFVLDMGEPVKIDDLARSMIRLMGLEVRDDEHPDGDIAIEYIGLRARREAARGAAARREHHADRAPAHHASHEPFMRPAQLEAVLEALRAAMESDDVEAIHAVLTRAVEGYGPEPREPEARKPRESGAPDGAALVP